MSESRKKKPAGPPPFCRLSDCPWPFSMLGHDTCGYSAGARKLTDEELEAKRPLDGGQVPLPDGPRQKLFIPACGDRITLTADWTFTLYLEYRNTRFAQERGMPIKVDESPHGRGLPTREVTLPAGTVLECDRVYIRTFSKSALTTGNDYDSITWKVVKDDKLVRNQRFWVKLPDCYEIEYECPLGSLYRDRVKVVKAVMEA